MMRKADFTASIKKIEIINKVMADSWDQSIRVTLGDIELTNENLVELRQFKPNEPVKVIIEPQQASPPANDNGEVVELEENQPEPSPDTVVKMFKF